MQVVGRALSKLFDVEIHDRTGKCTLKYLGRAHAVAPPERSGANSASFIQNGSRSIAQILMERLLGAEGEDDSEGSEDEHIPIL